MAAPGARLGREESRASWRSGAASPGREEPAQQAAADSGGRESWERDGAKEVPGPQLRPRRELPAAAVETRVCGCRLTQLGKARQGKLFLDDTKVKNFITCFKDKQFLAFFFKQLKVNRSGRYEDTFPYLSPCGREHNYIRCDDRPVVFTHLLQGASGEELLSYCGGADRLTVPFRPEKLLMLPENGRVYHPGPEKAGGVGLVKSALAYELSPNFEYEQGPSQPPTHFHWRDQRHTLTNELLPFIRDREEEKGA